MNLTPEQIEDELTELRRIGAAAEIQGSVESSSIVTMAMRGWVSKAWKPQS